MADMSVIRRLVLRNKGSGGGAPVWVWWWVSELSVCSHYTDYTAPTPHQEQGHTATRGGYLVDTLTLTYYTIN